MTSILTKPQASASHFASFLSKYLPHSLKALVSGSSSLATRPKVTVLRDRWQITESSGGGVTAPKTVGSVTRTIVVEPAVGEMSDKEQNAIQDAKTAFENYIKGSNSVGIFKEKMGKYQETSPTWFRNGFQNVSRRFVKVVTADDDIEQALEEFSSQMSEEVHEKWAAWGVIRVVEFPDATSLEGAPVTE
jgi:endonuclease YncB( thermonuclease family)